MAKQSEPRADPGAISNNRRRLLYLLVAIALSLILVGFAPDGTGNNHRGKSAPVYWGDTTRLQAVMQKARTNKQITIGFIGGSITHGFGVDSPDECYAGLVRQWWEKRFPATRINYVNAGVDGMTSRVAISQVEKSLLQFKPDFVITEFAVNDHPNQHAAESYAHLTRMILNSPNPPADILLFMIRNDRNPRNVQDQQIPIGLEYKLPMVSFRNWVEPRLLDGKIRWKDFMLDEIHPNDEGHRMTAELIIRMLDEAYYASENSPPSRHR